MSKLRVKIWVCKDDGEFGLGHIQIMSKIAQTGSILAASKAMKMSYKKTWSKKASIEEILGGDIFISQPGRGGTSGTALSHKAEQIAKAFEQLECEIALFANERFEKLLKPLLDKENS